MFRRHRLSRAFVTVFCTGSIPFASAQITLDGTMGPAGALAGPNYQIPAGFGTQVGGNLFHSFGLFNVGTAQSATFSGPGSVNNIIGRVTGGAFSNIDGAIRSTIQGANLFLVNPAGMLFGPNASLDVSGSFHASTAHYVKLGTDGRFDTINPNGTVLSSAPPSAFGFVGAASAIVADRSVLTGAAGRGLTFVGGPMQVSGATLSAPGGSLNLASVASAGEVSLAASDATSRLGPAGGIIELVNGTIIDASATANLAGGRIVIRGGTLTLQDATVVVRNEGPQPGLGVVIDASVALAMERSAVATLTLDAGSAGPVSITSPSISIAGGVPASPSDVFGIVSQSQGRGAAGAIDVQTTRLTMTAGATIQASATAGGQGGAVSIAALDSVSVSGAGPDGFPTNISSFSIGAGNGGDVLVVAPVVALDGGAILTNVAGAGAAGNIGIEANRVSLANGGTIDSSSFGMGAAGAISVTAAESITVTGGGGLVSRIGSSAFARGAGGAIVLDAPRIDLTGAQVNSSSSGAGAAGNITVRASDLTASFSTIDASAEGAGAAGNVDIQAARVVINDNSQINSSALESATGRIDVVASESISIARRNGNPSVGDTGILSVASGAGSGGAVTVSAPTIDLDGGVIRTRSFGAGRAGDITVDGARLTLTSGGQIDSSAFAAGAAGNLTIDASESIDMSGRDASIARTSGFFTAAVSSGAGGNMVIRSPAIIVNNALINADALSTGAPGDITIEAQTLALVDGGKITANTHAPGPGGRINITASESFTVIGRDPSDNPSAVAGTNRGAGLGSDIVINTPVMTVDGGLISTASFDSGAGGSVTVDAGRVALVNGGQIVSDSHGAGAAGNVSITAPSIIIDAGEVRADAAGGGIGGRIAIDTSRLTLTQGGKISSSAAGAGIGGTVDVTASEALTITGNPDNVLSTGLFATTFGLGRGGEITVKAPVLEVESGTIASTTLGAGPAGRIAVEASDVRVVAGGIIDSSSLGGPGAAGIISIAASNSIEVSGRAANGNPSTLSSRTDGPGAGGDLVLSAPTFTLNDAVVSVNTTGRGSGGRIALDAERVTISGGGVIASGTGGIGDGGTLNVTATESILVTGRNAEGRSRIINSSAGFGDAGQIALTAPSITLADGGFVNGNASQSGAAGSIRIRGGSLSLSAGEISTSTTASGRGGSIDIAVTGSVDMTDSAIRATSGGSGDAGSIFIDAGRSLTLTGSAITTEATRADGGNIEIMAIDLLRLTDSEITTSVGTGAGNGGNITIDPVFVILDSSQIIANAFGGNGGNIRIVTNALLQSGDSIISASSQLGIEGTIEISAPDNDLEAGLTPLPGGLFDSSLLLRESCSARAGRGGNSFVGVGYGGLPERPGTLAFSSYAQRPAAAGQSAPLFALAASFENACTH